MEPPGEGDRGAQDGAPREELHVGSGVNINITGSGSSRAGSIFTTYDRLISGSLFGIRMQDRNDG
jgi:hypothetical protein